MAEFDPMEHKRLILLIIAGVTLLAVIIAVSVSLIGNARRASIAAREEAAALERQNQGALPFIDELEMRREDIVIPPSLDMIWRGRYRPYEPQRRQWSTDDVKKYLYDPRELGGENLRKANQQLIDDMLEQYR